MEKEYKIKADVVGEMNEDFKELEDLLTERISDMYEIKGMMQARHAYIYYRSLLYNIKCKFQGAIRV